MTFTPDIIDSPHLVNGQTCLVRYNLYIIYHLAPSPEWLSLSYRLMTRNVQFLSYPWHVTFSNWLLILQFILFSYSCCFQICILCFLVVFFLLFFIICNSKLCYIPSMFLTFGLPKPCFLISYSIFIYKKQ